MFTADRKRHAAISKAIDGILAPKQQAPAPAAADHRSPREKVLELHPHSKLASMLKLLGGRNEERANDAPRAKDLLAILRGGQDAREAAQRLGLPEHLIPVVAQRIRDDIVQAQHSAALGNGRKKPPVDSMVRV